MAMASMANSSFTARHLSTLHVSPRYVVPVAPWRKPFFGGNGTPTMGISWDIPLVMCDIATENDHRKSWCTHFFNGDFPYLCDVCVCVCLTCSTEGSWEINGIFSNGNITGFLDILFENIATMMRSIWWCMVYAHPIGIQMSGLYNSLWKWIMMTVSVTI